MIAAFDPPQVRKAAAFAEAIRRVEEEFGYRLESAADGLVIGGPSALPGSPFLLVRTPLDDLALGVRVSDGEPHS